MNDFTVAYNLSDSIIGLNMVTMQPNSVNKGLCDCYSDTQILQGNQGNQKLLLFFSNSQSTKYSSNFMK